MRNKKIILLAIVILTLTTSCGRKGDLLPPPNINYDINFQKIIR
tara:strand:+ start:651 stop:782 length:132 start_codon:yes stop_codon:yes gene_type:complete